MNQDDATLIEYASRIDSREVYEDHEEDRAGALRERLDAGMEIDAIDRVVPQECHWETPKKG